MLKRLLLSLALLLTPVTALAEITVVASESGSLEPNGGAETVPLPAGTQPGDVVVVALSADDGIISTGNTRGVVTEGYIVAVEAIGGPGTQVAYKVMADPADTTVDIDGPALKPGTYAIRVLRGVDPIAVLASPPQHASATSNGVADPPEHTGTGLSLITCHYDDDEVADVIAPPSGYSDYVAGDTANDGVYGATVLIASAPINGTADPGQCIGGFDWWAATHLIFTPVEEATSGADLTLDGQAFNLTWADEFDFLDLSQWEPPITNWSAPLAQQHGNAALMGAGAPGIYEIVQDEGESVLRIRMTFNTARDRWESGGVQSMAYRVGGDNGMNGVCQVGGYWEARMKMAGGAGTWNAFWLLSDEYAKSIRVDGSLLVSGETRVFQIAKRGEIDVMEQWGRDLSRGYINVHRHGADAQRRQGPNAIDLPTGTFAEAYHRIGVWIDEESRQMKFYLDRVLQPDVTVDMINQSGSNLAWLQRRCWFAVLSLSASLGHGTPADPSFMHVDYVRAYQEVR